MFKKNIKIFLLVIIIGLIFISSQAAFAQGDNETGIADDNNQLTAVDMEENNIDNPQLNGNDNADDLGIADDGEDDEKISSSENITLLIVSDNPGTNILEY